jgi:hypothetical protein
MSPMNNAAMHSPLMTALTKADDATKLLMMNTCHPQNATVVTCTQPYFAVQTVTFRTYPSLTALYRAYIADVRQLGNTKGSSINVNFGNCSKAVNNGEVSWNHNFVHPKIYSLAQSISGMLNPSTQAAGRVFCTIDNNGDYHLVWTEDGRPPASNHDRRPSRLRLAMVAAHASQHLPARHPHEHEHATQPVPT